MTAQEFVQRAKETLMIEAEALIQASSRIDKNISQALEILSSATGKIVVVGLGKSGHIGRKISATMASTGTPSFFLHPSEALHGDMGMIQKQDVILAIAQSGETHEVLEVCRYARRSEVPIISITGNPESSLAMLSQVALDSSVEKEACPLNLAPTASSTLALAIGDALAVSLMAMNRISEEDFARWHPAGSLGKKLSLVRDIMDVDVRPLCLEESAGFHTILEAITTKNYGIAAVINPKDGALIGCITDGDVRRALLKFQEKALTKRAKDLMTQDPVSISAGTLTIDAVNLMEKKRNTAVFVTDGEHKKLCGIIKMHNILTAKIL